ncbi:hypothetical protein BMS3Abin02_01557 [bacterium BMS3Abin02]|nr:hypothetical protein BMS3Abin02_01557 [bacterium BMS3Abin02]
MRRIEDGRREERMGTMHGWVSLLTVLAIVLAFTVIPAQAAEALSCSTGDVVWIKSNTTINAGHGWNSGYNYFPSGGWHTTVTQKQNSGITWIDTDGVLYSGQIYCSYPI